MNPLELAKLAAGESDAPLEAVSPVYAELASIAKVSSSSTTETQPPDYVAEAEEALESGVMSLRRLKELAVFYQESAEHIEFNPSIPKLDKVRVLLLLADTPSRDHVLPKVKEILDSIPLASSTHADVGDAHIDLALADRTPASVITALSKLTPMGTASGHEVDQRLRILLLTATQLGLERTENLMFHMSLVDKARALTRLGIHTGDKRKIREAYAIATGQASVSASDLANVYAAIYAEDHNPDAREGALRNLVHADNKIPVLIDIASVDLTRESIDQIGIAADEEKAAHPQLTEYVDTVYAKMAAFYAQAGMADSVIDISQRFADQSAAEAARADACRIFSDLGDLVSAKLLYLTLSPGMQERAAVHYIPALIVAGQIDKAQAELQDVVKDDVLNYQTFARMAVAFRKRASMLEAEMAAGGAVTS